MCAFVLIHGLVIAGPLPRFEGIAVDASAPNSRELGTTSPQPAAGAPIRVPPLNPDDVNKFTSLFDKSDVNHTGVLPGETAKQIFERARLPNDILGRIWNLSDTQQRGALDATEFIIAMHLLTSYRSGVMKGIPQALPPGFYDAASRRGSRSSAPRGLDVPPVPAIPRQFTGSRTESPINRSFGSPLSAQATGGGADWLISPQDKAHYDNIFGTVDTAQAGIISGDQAVSFFLNANLPEETLAQIWDLADIDADGQLNKDEFAVAMYLVRLQRGGKQPLPQALPLALIPPSMRGGLGAGQLAAAQAVAPLPAAAPAAAPAPAPAAPAPAPPSAADDLFGLDPAPGAPGAAQPAAPSQVPQTTGGSNMQFQPPASPTGASSTFKPFVPTSSFGQSLQPQMTGGPQPVRSPPPPADDLLGDNDPEESKKLTNETTELANLSNQIGSLSNEMQNTQTKRTAADQELSQSSQQKRDFESRLAQARSMYEQEVKNYKALEERLNASKAETAKLQQEFALIDGSRQDLQTQYEQASAALTADQQENASLKEKIREANAAVAQLKPALEKARSSGRQQKGLVAINKKQLATVEGEQEKMRGEIDGTPKGSERGSATASPAPEGSDSGMGGAAAAAGGVAAGAGAAGLAAAAAPSVSTPPAESSPSPNTNPFFKMATGSSGPDSHARSPEASSDQQRAFDSLFGPSFGAPSGTTPPPPTSFRADSPSVQQAGSGVPTPSTSPPPPSQSRQFTPSVLPFREAPSGTSSTIVSPPASTAADMPDTSGFSTPPQGRSAAATPSAEVTSAPARSPFDEPDDSAVRFPDVSSAGAVVGAGAGAGVAAAAAGGGGAAATEQQQQGAGKDPSFDELFGGPAHQRSQSQKANDFEEAFAAMKQSDGQKPNGGAGAAAAGTGALESEFPPIREMDDDDDDDSTDNEGPMGFDDNFTPVYPPGQQPSFPAPPAAAGVSASPGPRPEGQQPSPPTYDQSVPHEAGEPPAQFNGLLPGREDPTVAPDAPHSIESSTGAPVVGNEVQRDTSAKPSGTDFESAFAGMNLAPAKVAEDDDDDDDDDNDSTAQKNPASDFDFSFDSPANQQQKSNPNAPASDFFSFDNNAHAHDSSSFPQPPGAAGGSNAPNANSHDWESLFAPLDNISPDANANAQGAAATSPFPSPPKQPQGSTSSKEPGWALQTDTGEDDLILQRLTGMGFSRDDSLAALEKFDYNLDKVCAFYP